MSDSDDHRTCVSNSTKPGYKPALIFRNARVNLFRPGVNAACPVVHFGEAGLPQEIDRLGAASAHLAVDNDFAAGGEFVDALGQIIQRNEVAVEVADLVLVWFADVEQEKIVAAITTLFEFFDG